MGNAESTSAFYMGVSDIASCGFLCLIVWLPAFVEPIDLSKIAFHHDR